MSYRRQMSIWIGATCLLLILTGTVQFLWIGSVGDSQQHVVRDWLIESLFRVREDFRYKLWLLLTAFKADADVDQERRQESYVHRYYSWHELSQHGPAVKRVLFHDLTAGRGDDLTALNIDTKSIEPATWDEGLAPVRRYVSNAGFKLGRGISPIQRATWVLHPSAMAVSRPMVSADATRRINPQWPSVTGNLILQLDLEFIRGRMIPNVLQDHLGSTALRDAEYEVTVTLDDEILYSYKPVDKAADPPGPPIVGYLLNSRPGRDATERARSPDWSIPLFRPSDVPEIMSRRGAAQGVLVHSRDARIRMITSGVDRPGLSSSTAPVRATDLAELIKEFREVAGLPRLFVIAGQQHRLALEARRVGVSLNAAVQSSYNRLLAVGMLVLMLLTLAMAMIAITGSRAAQRAEDRMAAVTSQAHQLRNPLAVMLVLAEGMVNGALGRSEKALEYGRLIRSYGQRLSGIVDRAAQASAIDSLSSRSSLSMLDVSEVARDALEDLRPLIEGAGFEAECALAEGLPTVRADAEALEQCVGELLSNAVKYGLPGRWVRLETCEAPAGRGGEVRIRVHDRGPGMSEREASKVFEPYYRGPGDSTGLIPGSGLGLTLARDMVVRMHGRLTVESEKGRGSVFTIHLPAGA
ncbi:MAG: HAMP domain-containing histidine kinase [Chloroflexi bacterium]|nr:HAMP domain-containing histidine kinase [Chloroflexota bacterium]